MRVATTETILMLLIAAVPACLLITLAVMLIRALWKYIHSEPKQKQQAQEEAAQTSLGEAIKENRQRCNLTQEQVAEKLSVSRQAVSKWENGTAEPSTANLLALAELFGVSIDTLLHTAQNP